MTFIEMVAFIFTGAIILWFVIIMGFLIATENGCLAAGYRDFRVTTLFNRYCTYRKDQTDVVVQYYDALKNPLLR